MDKSPDAFRTISEVAEWLDTPAHVLRFWESRFAQVKPVKRAGGRRYYRPSDMLLLGGIKKLLHEDGMTIRGVQKLLREEGVKHVAGFSAPIDAADTSEIVDADDAEAPIQIDVPQEPVDNVVPIVPAQDVEHEPELQTHAEADLADLEMLDGPAETEIDTEALFSQSLDEDTQSEPATEAASAPAADEPMLPFGRGRIHPEEAKGPLPDPEAPPPSDHSSEPDPAPTIALGADIPEDPEDADLHTDVMPAGLALATSLRKQRGTGTPRPADQLAHLYARLTALRDRMARN
jgi:DNA-binding transcriptional MerR regulator